MCNTATLWLLMLKNWNQNALYYKKLYYVMTMDLPMALCHVKRKACGWINTIKTLFYIYVFMYVSDSCTSWWHEVWLCNMLVHMQSPKQTNIELNSGLSRSGCAMIVFKSIYTDCKHTFNHTRTFRHSKKHSTDTSSLPRKSTFAWHYNWFNSNIYTLCR